MIINDLDGYYIVFDTKNWNTELDTLAFYPFTFLPFYPFFLAMIIVTPARMARMPKAS